MKNFLRLRPVQRVLYITSAGVDCYRVSRLRTTLEQQFEQDEFAIARFYEYTASAPDAVYTLVADLIEEDFRTETIPPLRGAERQALLARRTGQAYRDTPFVASVSLGRETQEQNDAVASSRRDEVVQLMALTNPDPVQFWLKLLLANEHKIAAILSPATLASHAANALGVPHGAERLVLATLTSAGLRQTYVETLGREHESRRSVRFSRLASDPGESSASPAVRASGLVAEVARTHQYLQGLRLIARDAPPVPVALVVPRAEVALFDAALRSGDGARLVAQVFAVDDVADTLFVNAAVRRGGRNVPASFATPAVTQFFRISALRSRIIAAGALAGVVGMITGIALSVQALAIDGATTQLNQQTAALATQYRQTAAAFPKSPAPLATMRTTVTAVERLQAQTANPEALLRAVGASLETSADFQIQRVDWQLATTPSPPVPTDGLAAAAPPAEAAPPAQGAASAGVRYEVVVLSGRVLLPEPYRYAQAMAQAREITERLRQVRGVQVSVVTWPVDITPEGRIAVTTPSDSGVAAEPGSGSRLVVRIARPLRASSQAAATSGKPA